MMWAGRYQSEVQSREVDYKAISTTAGEQEEAEAGEARDDEDREDETDDNSEDRKDVDSI